MPQELQLTCLHAKLRRVFHPLHPFYVQLTVCRFAFRTPTNQNQVTMPSKYTHLKFNSSPLKSYLPKKESANHHFSGAMLNFGSTITIIAASRRFLFNRKGDFFVGFPRAIGASRMLEVSQELKMGEGYDQGLRIQL